MISSLVTIFPPPLLSVCDDGHGRNSYPTPRNGSVRGYVRMASPSRRARTCAYLAHHTGNDRLATVLAAGLLP
jgi:hypothetical protein